MEMATCFFVRNQFISNLVLDSLKFKKLLEVLGKELRNLREIVHCTKTTYQLKSVPKQCGYEIVLEFNSH